MKFVHTADVHLDSPLRGLQVYEGAPVDEIRGATRKAFKNLIDFCCDQEIDFLIIAGDLYDGDLRDYNTALFFSKQMSRLKQQGIQVYIVRGNHDAASRITKNLSELDNVHIFKDKAPETFSIDKLQVALHGQSYFKSVLTDNIVVEYPRPSSGYFNIGVLHTCISGKEGHEPYAPCNLSELSNKGYDYWALGHIHKKEILSTNPYIVYPGNIQGRHIRETGEKGAVLVNVDDNNRISIELFYTDVLRWHELEIDASSTTSLEEVIERFKVSLENLVRKSDDRLLAVRVIITGKSQIHNILCQGRESWIQQLRLEVNDMFCEQVWIEKVKIQTCPLVASYAFVETDNSIGELIRLIKQYKDDSNALIKLVEDDLRPLKSKLPTEISGTLGELSITSPEYLTSLLPDAQEMLISRLISSKEYL